LRRLRQQPAATEPPLDPAHPSCRRPSSHVFESSVSLGVAAWWVYRPDRPAVKVSHT